MAFRPMTTLRHAVTAFGLLIAALASVEVWMWGRNVPAARIVTAQCSVEDQSLLVPSAVCHHELRRLLKTTHRANERSPSHPIRINSLGCRGEEPDVPAPKGRYRILLLGDDTICGTAVGEDETVAARLKQFLVKSRATTADIEVINGGIPGYCPLLSWLKFEHELAKLQPQLVILHVDMTDVDDDANYRSLLVTDEKSALCPHTTLRLPAKPETAIMQLVRKSSTANWVFATTRQHGPELLSVSRSSSVRAGSLAWIADNPPDLRLQVRHALSPIQLLKEAVELAGGRLLVTSAPVLWQVLPAETAPQLSEHCGISGVTPFNSQFPFEVLNLFCTQSQIHFCDTSLAFRGGNQADRLFSKDAPVLTKTGMALYAREIARYLITNPTSKW